jgi:small subunit ribosomal protein S20
VRKLQEAIEAKDKNVADAQLRACAGVLDSAASSGVIHRNTAARRKSRLVKLLAGISTT